MRTDSQLQPEVTAELKWEPAVHAAQIGVEVTNGVVTLAGTSSRHSASARTQTSANRPRTSLAGVTGASNLIAIKASLSATVLKSDIEAAFKRRASADAKTIAVDVKGGEVTLSGSVHSWAERDLATRSAWGSVGVRNVVDKMTLSF